MKPLIIAFVFMLAAAVSAFAQTGNAYQFDNFDFANGVRVQQPAQPVSTKTRRGRLTTANWTPNPNGLDSTSLVIPTSMTLSKSLDGYTTGNSEIDGYIVDSGTRHGVDPLLLYAIMHQESTFKARAVSYKGARGLMQLMPGTAARYGVNNIFDPKQNIEGGTRYMKFLLNLFDGDVKLALAGYNAGEGAVMKYGYQIPPYSETQEYVRRIGRRYALMRDPSTPRYANSISRDQVAVVRTKDSAPLSIYERNVFAVRLPDGRLQLMSQ
ncbi:MAG TPA: lytic transglycosylase domain-containing protein [Pyrinomonadaceae bacterium]|nr:lytic transglycosylase domain-containing protein [Pyrinomonadaceae bacterium]